MIGPRTVLTAAHCLRARGDRGFVRPSSVRMLLGYHRGEWVAEARGAAIRIGPDYAEGQRAPGADWALVTLERDIAPPDRLLRLLAEPPPPGTRLMLAGYQQDRPEVLLADTRCAATGFATDPAGHVLLAHGCAGTRGASGAPLLAQGPDGRWAVAGIAVAVTATGGARGYAVSPGAIPWQR